MPLYEYRGLDRSGKSIKGSIDAESERSARLRLKKDGIYLQSLKNRQKANAAKKPGSVSIQSKVTVEDMSLMTRQLATLLKANVPLVECLTAVADQIENPYL